MMAFSNRSTAEQDLINGLRAGGPQRRLHENRLYEQFFYFIRQGMGKYNLPEEAAASVYSDTIIGVIQNVISGKFEGRASLKSYAYQIFANKCVDVIRKETTIKQGVHHTAPLDSLAAELPDRSRTVVQELIRKNEWSLMLEKLKEVGEKCRQVLLLFEDGYSDKEIAALMQYNSAEVVKTSRLRCLEKLREKVMKRNRNL